MAKISAKDVEDERNQTNAQAGNWGAALLLGLLSSTFSTLFITFGVGRIGRDPAVDWMQVGIAYFRRGLISIEPTWEAIFAGIFVHQLADIFWAVVFFGLLWGWTRRLSPLLILTVGIPWAIITAAIEYFLILPWLQPWLPMQVPYWTALAVHLTSSAAYPLFPSPGSGWYAVHCQGHDLLGGGPWQWWWGC